MSVKNGWTFKNIGGDLPKVERSQDMNDFYASATVTVGDSLCLKKEHSHYWSDRVPEATGRGGFLIMPKINKLEEYYPYCMPMYNWGDFEQLEKMISNYLTDHEERERIRLKAWNITKEKHTYVNRAEEIIEIIFR
jgi:spore maturation protein CgeB